MDEEKRTITTDEAVFQTINILSRIQVPARLVREIGIPISQAISNLEACMEAWAREENEERMTVSERRNERDGRRTGGRSKPGAGQGGGRRCRSR